MSLMRRSDKQNRADLDGCFNNFCILFFAVMLIAGVVFYFTGGLS